MFNNITSYIPKQLSIPKKWIEASVNGLEIFFSSDELFQIEKRFLNTPDRNISSISYFDFLLLGSALIKLNEYDKRLTKVYVDQINQLPTGFDKCERFRDNISEVIIAAKILKLNPKKLIPNYKTNIKSKNNNDNKDVDIHFEIGSNKYNLEIKNIDIENQPKMQEFRKLCMPVGTHTTFKSKHDKIIENSNIQGGTKNTLLKGKDKEKALKNNLKKAFEKFDDQAENIIYIGYLPFQHEEDKIVTQTIINEYLLNKQDDLVNVVFFESQRFWDNLDKYYSCIMLESQKEFYTKLNKTLRIHIF